MSRWTRCQLADHPNFGKLVLKNEKGVSSGAGLRAAEHCESADGLARGGEGETPGGKCPLVRFTIRRHRFLDVDAKFGSIKHLLDGVVASGIVAGDKEGQITLEVVQQKPGKGVRQSTEIEVFKIV